MKFGGDPRAKSIIKAFENMFTDVGLFFYSYS